MAGMRVLLPPFGRLPSASGREVPFVEGMPPIYHTTSGSTAVSRSVEFPMARLLLLKDRIAERPRDRRVLRGPGIEFDATRIQRIGCLLAGNTCVFGSFDRPAELAELCRRAEVTVIQLGAYALNGLAWSEDAVPLPSFTQVSVGGQRVPGSLRRRVIDRLTPNLWVQYATTEVGEISRATPEEHERFPEGVGIPPAHVTVEIVDDHDQPVAHGETGNIRVRKNVAPTSYVDDPVASRAFRGGFFHTGDLGSWRPGEPLIHHGRADDLMILNGINIRPAAIEDRLAAHPDVREAVAFPIRSRVHGEIPAAAVVRAGGDTDARALLAFCRETLGIRAPREIFIVDAMPRSTAGKPLRRALSERFSPARRAGG
jgi:acyl-CoA synthetase (AMP-forming)/AMP-acid ligase II